MTQKPSSRRKRSSAKSVLQLPDLDHAKAVLQPCHHATWCQASQTIKRDQAHDVARDWKRGSFSYRCPTAGPQFHRRRKVMVKPLHEVHA
jgi:hypothetical protein